jgi:hypothetical protein
VEVRQQHVPDLQPVFGGERQVLIDIALRIDDSGGAGVFVADEIRRVGETIKIKLAQNHGSSPLQRAGCSAGRFAR